MKATGIIRRIDDLGRVVIPKEVRRTLRIKEGDPFEIFLTEDGGVVFQPYIPSIKDNMLRLVGDLEKSGFYEIADELKQLSTKIDYYGRG